MVRDIDIRVIPKIAATESELKLYIERETGINAKSIDCIRILKRSIDARKPTIYINLRVRVFCGETPQNEAFERREYGDVSKCKSAIVVGAGPAGLFASLRLIELGIKPIMLERGKDVHARRKDIALISREHKVNGESNYSFGEGGAGAYSDGKLYTRSKKRGSVERILNILCQFGASESILYDAHPHIGTDKLPKVIENIRNQIITSGGEVYFEKKMTQLIVKDNSVKGVICEDGSEFLGDVILATGHSARDVYRYLNNNNIELEAKGFAVGVRLEHPQHLLDCIQYHSKKGRGEYLPAAEYAFVSQVKERGVYSFCMCPGGFVVPAASGDNQIVVNGMSPSNRGSKWGNSGMVVEIRPEDLTKEGFNGILAGLEFQERLEATCFANGKGQTAPAQRMEDFVKGRLSSTLPSTSYTPGVISSPLHFWMPQFITERLKVGFEQFGRKAHGFLTNEALMIGVETRTSSPVRIPRNFDNLQHIRLEGLYPCGEGAGYAGGIVSAAIDGERCAENLATKNYN
ncbi:MAG: FAD-binding protein [Bacteroidales bacterium]|nr:FAD-binding protein [Bacteroidales bacterium]